MKPASFILDLLRTYERKGTTARNVMEKAQLFNFSGNLIRVTLSRLVARGSIENMARGRYRLARLADPVNEFVEEWRLGEARRVAWHDKRFVLAHCESAQQKDEWVLHALGFRRLRPMLYGRPDNLAKNQQALTVTMHTLGLDASSVVAAGVCLAEQDSMALLGQYDIAALSDSYEKMTQTLLTSESAMDELSNDKAMVSSFMLGGEAIQLLAKDPLLPTEIQESAPRELLWRTMLRYDRIGREIWAHSAGTPSAMPASRTSHAGSHF